MKRKADPSHDSSTDAPTEPFVLETPIETPGEPPVEAVTELTPEPRVMPEQAVPRRSGYLLPLIGGALAGVAGFALAQFDVLDLRPEPQVDLSAIESQQAEAFSSLRSEQTVALEGLTARIDDLTQRLTEVESSPPPPTFDPTALDALDARLQAIEAMPAEGGASSAALTAKLADLERRIAEMSANSPAASELSAKVDAALADLAAAEEAATARADEAASVAEATRQRTALQDLRAIVDSGAPFEAALSTINEPDLQSALAVPATSGVATLASLQDSFPEAARAALRLARATDPAAAWDDRLVDFLAAQTGARSLTPREGSDPDAILSRADAAVQEGRLADALTEIAALDPAIAAPLNDWSIAAKQRLAAEEALAAAAVRLPTMEE